MQKIKIGQQAKSLRLDRADVAVGTKVRVILLDQNPVVKQLAFMSKGEGPSRVSRMVEIDEDTMIQWRVSPRPVYFFLVARVATDMKLKPIGDTFKVEYLQMSSTQYQKLVDRIDADGGVANFNTAILSKEKRVNEKGQDVSSVEAAFGYIKLDDDLQAAINKVTSNEAAMSSLWQLLDLQTSVTPTQWKSLVALNIGTSEPSIIAHKSESPAIEAPTTKELPVASTLSGSAEDIETADDFDSF